MQHIKSFLLTTAIAISITLAANAQPSDLKPLKEGIVCVSEQAQDELMKYAADGDRESMNEEIFNTGKCFVPQKGLKYRVLDISFMGVAKIKIYGKGIPNGQVVWTMKNEL
jgi:hypothetical protein